MSISFRHDDCPPLGQSHGPPSLASAPSDLQASWRVEFREIKKRHGDDHECVYDQSIQDMCIHECAKRYLLYSFVYLCTTEFTANILLYQSTMCLSIGRGFGVSINNFRELDMNSSFVRACLTLLRTYVKHLFSKAISSQKSSTVDIRLSL